MLTRRTGEAATEVNQRVRIKLTAHRLGLLAALFGLTGVLAGAFAAHGLAKIVSPERLAIFETAVRYQLFHALALLAIVLLTERWHGPLTLAAGWAFVMGSVLFSGSLYLLVLTDAAWLGVVTPFGGIGLLVGWAMLGLAALKRQ